MNQSRQSRYLSNGGWEARLLLPTRWFGNYCDDVHMTLRWSKLYLRIAVAPELRVRCIRSWRVWRRVSNSVPSIDPFLYKFFGLVVNILTQNNQHLTVWGFCVEEKLISVAKVAYGDDITLCTCNPSPHVSLAGVWSACSLTDQLQSTEIDRRQNPCDTCVRTFGQMH